MDMIVLVIVLALILLSVPIGFALFLATVVCFLIFTDLSLIMLGQAMFLKLDKFSLMSIMFFILAGTLMARGAMARKIVDFANAIVGHYKAGMPISGVLSCALFGAVSGSALATLSAIGGLMVPALKKKGMSEDFSVGLLTSSSILGIIIPPSIPMIIYCLVTDVSVAKLFMAGFLPGFLIFVIFSIYCVVHVMRHHKVSESDQTFSATKLWEAGVAGIWALNMPIIIFGGIFSGIFTATEAAVVAAVYAYLVEFFIYRELTIKEIARITINAGVLIASILIITAGSMVLSDYLTIQLIPNRITMWITSFVSSPILFIVMVNILLLIAGAFIEVIAAILILAPILFPVAMALGVDPIHFGVIMCINLGIGYITPPVGVNCYLSASLFEMKATQVFISIVPTLILLLISLAILSYFPTISTLLPDLLLK
ncbi:MAG: TRAP transporter large permease subunit [Syntrophales bacterium]|jgi:C4-dicarboxylate transporter DctM subunit|nr:TRAP transporter large permease subunit [Syntrophales bacterium]MDX9922874.1 TRAP transporter large permease subunit [Syntrophales bacterium]